MLFREQITHGPATLKPVRCKQVKCVFGENGITVTPVFGVVNVDGELHHLLNHFL